MTGHLVGEKNLAGAVYALGRPMDGSGMPGGSPLARDVRRHDLALLCRCTTLDFSPNVTTTLRAGCKARFEGGRVQCGKVQRVPVWFYLMASEVRSIHSTRDEAFQSVMIFSRSSHARHGSLVTADRNSHLWAKAFEKTAHPFEPIQHFRTFTLLLQRSCAWFDALPVGSRAIRLSEKVHLLRASALGSRAWLRPERPRP